MKKALRVMKPEIIAADKIILLIFKTTKYAKANSDPKDRI